jgi:transposase-like protein
MRQRAKRRQLISAARRGQIVQRVIVDGWTTARTAEAFELPQRLVEIWVTDYRRRGMASLRESPRRGIAGLMMLRLVCPMAALSRWLRDRLAPPRRVPPAAMPGDHDDRRGGSP